MTHPQRGSGCPFAGQPLIHRAWPLVCAGSVIAEVRAVKLSNSRPRRGTI